MISTGLQVPFIALGPSHWWAAFIIAVDVTPPATGGGQDRNDNTSSELQAFTIVIPDQTNGFACWTQIPWHPPHRQKLSRTHTHAANLCKNTCISLTKSIHSLIYLSSLLMFSDILLHLWYSVSTDQRLGNPINEQPYFLTPKLHFPKDFFFQNFPFTFSILHASLVFPPPLYLHGLAKSISPHLMWPFFYLTPSRPHNNSANIWMDLWLSLTISKSPWLHRHFAQELTCFNEFASQKRSFTWTWRQRKHPELKSNWEFKRWVSGWCRCRHSRHHQWCVCVSEHLDTTWIYFKCNACCSEKA